MVVASLTSFVGDHSVYAIFFLMAAAAVVPAASELVMIYAGALASGAVSDAHVVLFGHTIESHGWAYVTVALAGMLGNTVGAAGGWAIGRYGGRPLVERHGKWLHVTPIRLRQGRSRPGPGWVLGGGNRPRTGAPLRRHCTSPHHADTSRWRPHDEAH